MSSSTQSPPASPRYDYPSRAYPYPHVNVDKAHATSACIPPAPPPTAATSAITVGEYFFPFPTHSPHTRHSISGPCQENVEEEEPPSPAYPSMPRRSSFNYVHDLAEYGRQHPLPAESSESSAEESSQEEPERTDHHTTPPTTPGTHRRHVSLRDYFPLTRLPPTHGRDNPYESCDSAIEEDTSDMPQLKHGPAPPHSPPESPTAVHHPYKPHLRHHHRHHTRPSATSPPYEAAAGTWSHNCFNREDLKHLQHIRMLVEEAVEAFVVAGEERRNRRHSFGGEGFGFTSTPARPQMGV